MREKVRMMAGVLIGWGAAFVTGTDIVHGRHGTVRGGGTSNFDNAPVSVANAPRTPVPVDL